VLLRSCVALWISSPKAFTATPMDLTRSKNPSAEQPSTRRTFVTVVLLVIGALVWVVFSATPALADEFVVGIVVGQTTSDMPDSTFMDGFQLAVDQSPDVSHPAGVEGGDHLGSMDVVMVAVEGVTDPDRAVAAVVDLIERDGVAFIVADVSREVLASIIGPVTESGTMLIAMSDISEAEFPATLFFFAVSNQDQTALLLTDRTPVFEDAFVAAYGGPPSEAATRGYVAGRLVDVSVEATDRDPSNVEAIVDGLVGVTTPSNTSATEMSPVMLADLPTESEPSRFDGRLVAIIVLVLVVIAWAVFRRSQQTRRAGEI